MQVYKFGGASIATPERMQALLPIIREADQPLLIVISAMGKTTNALEAINSAACAGNKEEAHELVTALEEQHLAYMRSLFNDEVYKKALPELTIYFTELQWAVDDASADKFDYSYDQIVCMGELFSTRVAAWYFQQEGYNNEWIDVRDVVRTDDTFRDARVDWDVSMKQAKEVIKPFVDKGISVVTQGFIGATADNASVTLGREGSDYTAALMAAWLGATGVSIWKDVNGLLNADPKLFPNTVKIEAITYHEVIEMAYYGAQVIHPKTIKPLQNAGIPLYVKCFLDKSQKGTVITQQVNNIFYPPLIVLKDKQILLQVTTRDFSFITEDNLRNIYGILHNLKIKVNLIQNAAISFVACIDHKEEQVQLLIAALAKDYQVLRNEDVSLLTVRHYSPEILFDLTKGRYMLLEQKTRHTVQVVLK